MKKCISKILAGVIALAMILGNFTGMGVSEVRAAFNEISIYVEDEDMEPIEGIYLILKNTSGGKDITFGLTDDTGKAMYKTTTNKTIKWTTSNKKYATVDSKGMVSVKKAGAGKTVTITAAATDGSGKKAAYKIKIMKNAVKSIKLKAAKSVKAGKSLKVKATVKTSGKKANKTLKWTSSNTKYATVSSKGVVKTKKAGKGKKVKITAMSTDGSSKKKTVTVTIK